MSSPAIAQCINAGDLEEAFRLVKGVVRSAPTAVEARSLLAQMYGIAGDWGAMRKHLAVLMKLEPGVERFCHVYAKLADCEEQRAAVFSGDGTPPVLGEAPPWLAGLIEGLAQRAVAPDKAAALFQDGLNGGDGPGAIVNGQRKAWFADADMTLGPTIELIVDEQYGWVPMAALKAVAFRPGRALVDILWRQVSVTLSSGQEMEGFMPARYARPADTADAQLGRRTEWDELLPGVWSGRGSRVFYADSEEIGISALSTLLFDSGEEGLGELS